MKFSAVVTRYFSFTGLSQNNPKWEGSEEVSSSIASAPRSLSLWHLEKFSCHRAKKGWSFQPCEQRAEQRGGGLCSSSSSSHPRRQEEKGMISL